MTDDTALSPGDDSGSGPQAPAAMDLRSMTLAGIEEALSNVHPPYSLELLEALDEDDRAGARLIREKLFARERARERDQARIERMLAYERKARAAGFEIIAGVDEVGRGPLAGPVVAAAVILPPELKSARINDSKAMSEARRNEAMAAIVAVADVGVGVVSPEEIDRVNIYKANLLAMRLAIEDLDRRPDIVLVDGKKAPGLGVPQRAIVKGDRLSMSIAAASIVAKVIRDRMMVEFDRKYPQYMFAKHKGYGTAEHLESIRKNGACPIHRRSFAPIRESLRGKAL